MACERLTTQVPQLSEKLDNIKKILDVEKERYESSKQKSQQIVTNLLEKGAEINDEVLIQLYDSQGISPELIREEAQKRNKMVIVPDNFFARVAERHERKEQVHATK